MAIKLECTNCVLEKELPENISLERLNAEADQFFKEHKTRIGNRWCRKQNIFIRTFSLEKKECGNCGRPATHSAGGINRCDRCKDL